MQVSARCVGLLIAYPFKEGLHKNRRRCAAEVYNLLLDLLKSRIVKLSFAEEIMNQLSFY